MPSPYRLRPLSVIARCFYLDIFALSFLYKIYVLIFYSQMRGAWSLHIPTTRGDNNLKSCGLYLSILDGLQAVFYAKLAHKAFFGSYTPCVLSSQQIDQLAVLHNPKKLKDTIAAGKKTIPLSYHLLKFMRENCQLPAPVAIATDPAAHLEPAIFLQEEKEGDPARCRHPWTPRMQWQAVSVPQSSAAPDSKSIAELRCEACQETLVTCELGFDSRDKAYTQQRFNIDFETEVLDASIRGALVTAQFSFGLPRELSLQEGVNSFIF